MMKSYQAKGEIPLSLKNEDFFLFNGIIIMLCFLIYYFYFDRVFNLIHSYSPLSSP